MFEVLVFQFYRIYELVSRRCLRHTGSRTISHFKTTATIAKCQKRLRQLVDALTHGHLHRIFGCSFSVLALPYYAVRCHAGLSSIATRYAPRTFLPIDTHIALADQASGSLRQPSPRTKYFSMLPQKASRNGGRAQKWCIDRRDLTQRSGFPTPVALTKIRCFGRPLPPIQIPFFTSNRFPLTRDQRRQDQQSEGQR